jgi:1-phosphofructokinase
MSTVGAGDAMVAGLIAGHAQGLALDECARLATAFAVGAVTHVGAHLPAREALQAYVDRVLIRAPAGQGRPAPAAPASEERAGIARII